MKENWPAHLFLVGCGNMAGQMLTRWLACGLDPARVTVFRPSGRPVGHGIKVTADYPDALPADSLVLLGMKPYQLSEVANWLAPLCGQGTNVISILAGTPVFELRKLFPKVEDILRAMPNLPVLLGQGVIALHSDSGISSTGASVAAHLMEPLGLVEWIADEAQFNEVTALSGCGPAFLFRFVDALARAAEAIGLPEDQAARMALATVQGSANMAAQSRDSPAILANRVASPGGMTRQGLNVLDAEDRLFRLLADTLTAARDRGEEMARMS